MMSLTACMHDTQLHPFLPDSRLSSNKVPNYTHFYPFSAYDICTNKIPRYRLETRDPLSSAIDLRRSDCLGTEGWTRSRSMARLFADFTRKGCESFQMILASEQRSADRCSSCSDETPRIVALSHRQELGCGWLRYSDQFVIDCSELRLEISEVGDSLTWLSTRSRKSKNRKLASFARFNICSTDRTTNLASELPSEFCTAFNNIGILIQSKVSSSRS